MVNWISLSTTTGNSGETQITLTVSPNTEYSSRTTTLNVTTQSKYLTDNIVINQAQKSATGSMTFNPSGLSYSYEGGILYLHFTANTDWNVVSWPTWVGVSGDVSGGTGSYVWGVTALQNSGLVDLNSQFTFYCGGNYFTIPVHQDAYQESSSISVSPTSISNISSGGSAYTITITSNTGWTVTSKPEWVTLSATAGTGNGTITATIAANSGNTRTGSIGFSTSDNVASASVSLTQNAAYVEPSYISVSPSSISNISSGGSSYTLTVSANTNWTVTAKPEWATLSQTAGTGNATITVTIPANSGDTRTGNINFITTDNVASASVSLSQNAAYIEPSYISVSPVSIQNVSSGGSSYTLTVSANTNWSIESYPEWVTVSTTAGTGNATITVTVLPNTNTTRTGAIVFKTTDEVATATITVSQEASGTGPVGSTEYLTIECLANDGNQNPVYFYCTNSNTKTIEYSKNGSTWTSVTSSNSGSGTVITNLEIGEKLYLRGDNSSYLNNRIKANFSHKLYGNILSLINSQNYSTLYTLSAQECFGNLFTGSAVVDAEDLVLQATALTIGCYSGMFTGCVSLRKAPRELPATTLAEGCYYGMFYDCNGLTQAPAILPATTLVDSCYTQMFEGCRNLTTAPILPASTLAPYCYQFMFGSCSSLTYIKCLATNISAAACTQNWCNAVQTTSGTFVKSSSMSSWTTGSSGIPNNWTVQDA